jgi:hypothetical protein
MKRHRKYHLPVPPKMEGNPSPAEIIEALGNLQPTAGHPVELVSAGPPVEIIEAFPKPRLDPNRPLVPTEVEVACLPKWAKLAFASRCARRILPLLEQKSVETTSNAQLAVATIVKAVEQSAATATLQKRVIVTAEREVKANQYESIGNEAVTAALAAAHALACEAARATVVALQRLATVRTLRFVLLPRRDFDHVLRLAKEGKWTDDTPVPPDVFGPMWDRQPPAWWRDDYESLIDKLPLQS